MRECYLGRIAVILAVILNSRDDNSVILSDVDTMVASVITRKKVPYVLREQDILALLWSRDQRYSTHLICSVDYKTKC